MASNDEQIQVGISVDGSEAVSGADEAAEGIKEAADEITESLGETAEASESLSDRIRESFAKMGEAAREGATETKEQLESVATAIKGVQSTIALIGEVAVLGFIGDQIKEAIESIGEYGEAIEQAGQKTGVSTDNIQKFSYAARTVGLSGDEAQRSLIMLSRRMAEAQQGSVQAQASFQAVGVSMNDIKNLSMDQVLAKIATAFKDHADGANKAALAQQLLGRAGAQMIPLLNEGSEGLNEMGERASEVGAVIDAETIEAMARLGEDLHQLGADTDAASMSFKAQFAPALDSAVKSIDSFVTSGEGGKEMVKDLGEGLKAVVAVVLTVVTGFEQLGDVINGIAQSANRLGALDFDGVANAWSAAFQKTKADGDAYTKSLDALYNKEKDIQDLDFGNEEEKPKFNLPKTTGGAGAKDQFAIANAQAQAELAMLKQKILEENALNEDQYKTGVIDLATYYATRLNLTQEALKKEIAIKQATLSQTEALAGSAKTDQERMGMIAKEIALKGQLAVLNEQLTYSSVASAQQQSAAQASLNNQLLNMELSLQDNLAQARQKALSSEANDMYKNKIISQQQLLALEEQYETQLFDTQMAALQRRLSEEQNLTLIQKQQLNNQIIELQTQHDAQMASLAQQAADDQNKYNVQATTTIDDAFTKMFEQISSGTVNAKTILLDFFNSIDQGLAKVASQKLTESLFGAGTSGGNIIQSLLGDIGMGSSTTATAAQTAQTAAVTASTTALTALATAAAAAAASMGVSGAGSFAGAFGGASNAFNFTMPAADAAGDAMGSDGMSALMGLIPSFDVGSNYIPADTLAMVHQGEAIIPAAMNTNGMQNNVAVNNQFVLPNKVDLRTQQQIAGMAGATINLATRRNG